jgi:UDP-3-O-[3-hydroxymyristoyl] glucosamine N-acyltransferase
MQFRVSDVAAFLGGTVVGDPETLVSGIAGLTEAKPGDLSFLANPKYAPHLATTLASAVIVAEAQTGVRTAQIVVANPDFAFAKLVSAYGPKPAHPAPGIHPTAVIGNNVKLGASPRIGAYAVIGDDAVIGDQVVIYPHVVIGNEAQIGNESVLYANVTVRERCRLGHRVILQPGAVIGSDGFGYALVDGKHQKIPQVGIVVIEDDVEIGANTTIDRARFGKTRIGAGTKVDNLVQIAHNVETGSHCLLIAQVGISGSTRLGNYVTLAGQVGVAGHLHIGDQAMVGGQSGVSKNLPPKAKVRGSPAQDFHTAMAQEVSVRRLAATQQTVKRLEQRLAELEARLAGLERPG